MKLIIKKTIGGLPKEYYLKHLLFSMILAFFVCFTAASTGDTSNYIFFIPTIINALLYPYTRFLYGRIINFIMGNDNNYVIVTNNGCFFLYVRLCILAFAWSFSSLVAPISFIYLYFYNSKKSKED